MNIIEYIIATIIAIIIITSLFPEKEKIQEQEIQDYFEDYPLEYWHDTDKGGDVIWVRFRVLQDNTKLWVLDSNGYIVHETPMEFDLYDDGRDRVHKHRWKLYYTEWSQDILPGDYEIVVGSHLQNSQNLYMEVKI